MSIKKLSILISFALFFSLNLNASSFSKTATKEPVFTQKGPEKHWCPVCGMNIKTFYKTSHTAKLQSNKPRQYCSMRCLAVDMKEYKIDKKSIQVVDAKSEELIDATTAFYLVGSKVPGTMSKVSKLGFKNEADALEFKKKRKGKIVDFNTALLTAQNSLASDIEMIIKKKEKKMYPMGKKIFEKKCNQDINLNNYLEINDLKAAIKKDKLCKPLNEKHLQALSLYLWEVKRFGDMETNGEVIHLSKDEKCPICGMFVYKYPRWATQIFYGEEKHYSFDGVKDMMKYYFDHKEGITKILVLDYYSQKVIDATKAYYVIGSDIYGPMGNELIAFKSENSAKTFYKDHRATEILSFKEITQQAVYKLDE